MIAYNSYSISSNGGMNHLDEYKSARPVIIPVYLPGYPFFPREGRKGETFSLRIAEDDGTI